MTNNKRLNAINNKSEDTCIQRFIEIMSFWDDFKALHHKHPSLRVGQLLTMFITWNESTYGNDIFYIEDDVLSLRLEEFTTLTERED